LLTDLKGGWLGKREMCSEERRNRPYVIAKKIKTKIALTKNTRRVEKYVKWLKILLLG